MIDQRQVQIAAWTKMRRAGKLRYIMVHGLEAGAIAAGVLIGVAWLKTETVTLSLQAVIAFALFGLFGAAGARARWNRFEAVYPDLGHEPRPRDSKMGS